MGIKTLYRYLNEYKAADEKAQKLTREKNNLEASYIVGGLKQRNLI